MTWFKKISQSTSFNIIIEMDLFITECKQSMMNMFYSAQQRSEHLKTFKFDIGYIKNLLQQIQYPNSDEIFNAIQLQDDSAILESYFNLSNWSRQNISNSKTQDTIYELRKHIMDYADQLRKHEFTEEEYSQWAEDIIKQTINNMNNIKTKIQTTITAITGWSTPIVRIIPFVAMDSYFRTKDYSKPAENASVELGNDEYAPNFTVFQEGEKLAIDDILEAEDKDFFQTPQLQKDYFTLIKELQNPGSTTKAGKKLTLYTARPIKDRALYINSQQIPAGIFLTSKYNDAEGIAVDMKGSAKTMRDIWKVVIDERYLMLTLDTPNLKHYQVVSDAPVPVHSMKLIYPGE